MRYAGFKHTKETKIKISISNKGKHNHSGENNPFYGKKHTQQSKNKLRIANLGRDFNKGIENPFYGKKHTKETREKISKLLSGKNHPNYIDGRSYYPYSEDFNSRLKYKIRERDNFECQNCGMTEEEHLIVYGCVIEVHHIDYDKLNNKENNLFSLCKGCNVRANYNRKFWKEYYIIKMLNLLERKNGG